MARRKLQFMGDDLPNQFMYALGVNSQYTSRPILEELELDLPQLDWDKIGNKLTSDIPDEVKKDISQLFENEFGWRVYKTPSESEEPAVLSNSEFSKKAAAIERKANDLKAEIDSLAEISASMLVRPRSKNWITNFRPDDDVLGRYAFKAETPDDADFFDYYSFRKLLDYYSDFTRYHELFSEFIGARYQVTLDYSWYEDFIRRTVLALLPTNFDLSVTIPTDTNPDYESPIIELLNSILEQFSKHSNAHQNFADLNVNRTYRQHTHLILKLKAEFETSGIFWDLVWLKLYDKS